MRSDRSKKKAEAREISKKNAARLFGIWFGIAFVLAGFEHYEKGGSLGMSAAFILFGIAGFGFVAFSLLDERRERIRQEKIEDAERIAKILSTPLEKYEDNDEVLDKEARSAAKKYEDTP